MIPYAILYTLVASLILLMNGDRIYKLTQLTLKSINKNMKNHSIVSLVVTLVLFLAGAFFSASFNISEWSDGCRLVISMSWVLALIFINALLAVNTNTK